MYIFFMKEYTGKVFKIINYKEFSIDAGTINIYPLKSFYLTLESYVHIENQYKVTIAELLKAYKFKLKQLLIKTLPKYNLEEFHIIDIDVKLDSLKNLIENKKLFFNIEFTFFVTPNYKFDKLKSQQDIEIIAHQLIDLLMTSRTISFKRY